MSEQPSPVLPLGRRVVFDRVLVRETYWRDRETKEEEIPRSALWGRASETCRRWVSKPYVADLEGVVVGLRRLSNGSMSRVYSDEPVTWFHEEVVWAYLVAYDLRKKPVLVAPSDIR